ncbi:MAG: gamma-glutamyltransferase [Cytophagales bacterium]
MANRFLSVISIIILFFSCRQEAPNQNKKATKVFKNAAIVSAHPLASNIGIEVLKSGGNAFDAAVAVHFALAVVFPYAGNLGGGGFAVFLDSSGNQGTLDFREKAPLKADRNMYLDSMGNVIPDLSTRGALASGVPGSVKGIWELHKKYGKKDWSELIIPSIKLAKKGWILTYHATFYMNKYMADIVKTNDRINYLTQKENWKEGDSLSNEKLAHTLQIIADKGERAFYEGEIADSIIATMNDYGGIISKEDLHNYEPKWREALQCKYKGYEVYSMPPPSSGGWALISLLKMAEKYPFKEWGRWDFRTINTICEIEKRVYADRSKYLGDTDFYPVPLNDLLSDDYLNMRSSDIQKDKATASTKISPGLELHPEDEETTHFSIVDKEGNAVSITTTLNSPYGSKLMVNGCGFLLNNEMNDFSVKPGFPNNYGLIGGEANAIMPEKRMLSSMTPTILAKNNKPFLIIGTPGGSTIITTVFQNILNVIDFGFGMQESVEFPRFHHQWLPDSLFYEEGFFNFADSLELVKTGQNLRPRIPIGRVDAILLNSDGFWECGADPRRDDYANGY